MRESLRERDLLRDHLRQYAHSQANKPLRQPRVTVQPLRNYLDVSVGAQCTAFPSAGRALGYTRGGSQDVGGGAPAGSKGEKALAPSALGL